MEEKAKKAKKRYGAKELSAFCLQISLLLSSAVPLDEGLSIMAEDAGSDWEKQMLTFLSEEVELGEPFFAALEKTGAFPAYVVRMAKLGQQTGTLDQMMESLSVYYEKEYGLMRSVKNALTYPVIMIFMLLTVLFVLFTKVMPVFEGVYAQLGAQLSPVSLSAIRLGGLFSGAALALKSGLELEKGLELARELVENSRVEEQIQACAADLEGGSSYYEAMKKTGLFSGFQVQMLKVGTRSGRLDSVMEEISKSYEQEADTAIDNMLARFEPTMVAVLAVAVGLVLLSVMLPLAGILSAIG